MFLNVAYSEEIVRAAVRVFVWKRSFVDQKSLWATELAGLALLAWLSASGTQGWLFFVLIVALTLPPIMVAMIWFSHFHNTVGKFRRMGSKSAKFTFSDQGLEAASDLGSVQVPWSSIVEVWERPDYWMLFLAPNQFITLPTATLTSAERDWLRAKMR